LKLIYSPYLELFVVFSTEYREISNRLSTVEGVEAPEKPLKEPKKMDHPAHTSEKRLNNVTVIHMDIHDPAITKTGTCLWLSTVLWQLPC